MDSTFGLAPPRSSSSSSMSAPCPHFNCCMHPPPLTPTSLWPQVLSPIPRSSPMSAFEMPPLSSSSSSSNASGSSFPGFRDMPPPTGPFYNNAIMGSSVMNTPPPPPLFPVRRPNSLKFKFSFCVFCKNNGEDESYYLSHTLKDDHGRVVCPILSAYICPICGASGPIAHTIKYCPENKDGQYQESYAPITVLKQMRSSTGKAKMQLHQKAPFALYPQEN